MSFSGNGTLQVTIKPLESSGWVPIKEQDLRTPEQQEAWKSKPNAESEVASVKIPSKLIGKWKELHIISAAKVVDRE